MLKLLVYAKMEHVESAKYIVDMTRYHEVYRFVLMMLNLQNARFKGTGENTDVILK